MRIIVVFILFLFLGQQTTVNGQQTSCTVPEPVEGTTLGASTSSATACTRTVDCCPLTVDYYESQIHKADSLYKNYLPQYNFDEVKAAMEFFDSIRNEKLAIRNYGRRKAIPNSTFLIPNYQCAKAHYYHAVGLTERDDIVGACEHYLTALEIMEELMSNDEGLKAKGKKSVDNPEDYEKIRFLALTYTRLGRLFYNENYCDLAMLKYKNALKYYNIINDTISISYIYKNVGNVYQLLDKTDSALYHYRKSLEIYSGMTNKLDIEKSIAQILFNKGERDSAYTLIKNNLDKIENYGSKYSYYATLGNMYYVDKKYDSAIYYITKSINSNISYIKINSAIKLSAIYDSIGDYEKKAYYDDIVSKISIKDINKNVERSKFQTLYNNYKERKSERISIEAKARTRRITIISCLGAIIAIMFVFVYVRYNYKKQNDRLKGEIDDYANENKRLIDDFKKSNNKKDKIIDKQKKEIDRIKTRISKKNVNIEAYYASDICKKILSRKDNDFSCLKEDELALLLKSADEHLDNISERLRNKFPSLNKNDIYTICLLILNVEKGKLQYLLGKDRKTIWNRLNKIKSLMNVDENHDLFLHIKDNFLN